MTMSRAEMIDYLTAEVLRLRGVLENDYDAVPADGWPEFPQLRAESEAVAEVRRNDAGQVYMQFPYAAWMLDNVGAKLYAHPPPVPRTESEAQAVADKTLTEMESCGGGGASAANVLRWAREIRAALSTTPALDEAAEREAFRAWADSMPDDSYHSFREIETWHAACSWMRGRNDT